MVQATAEKTTSESSSLGISLRALRKARGLTLAELALAIGRSQGWISQLERGISDISISDLRRIASVLDVPIGLFFHNEDAPEEERNYVVRSEARHSLGNSTDGLIEELLSPDLGGGIELVRSIFEPGAQSGDPIQRDTEETGYVVSGCLDLWVGEKLFELREGDSFRFAGEPYRWRNPGEEPAIVIWAITPPVY